MPAAKTDNDSELGLTSRRGVAIFLIGLALLSSGAAGLVNEVVWQRALKRFLGGSETISSMVVVFVFMLGLGVGSILVGRRVDRVRHPLRTLAAVEILLAAANSLVCLFFRSDLVESAVQGQLLAAKFGVPMPLIFTASAILILLLPCLLMGATLPLAGEVCQRQLGFRNSRLLGVLFAVNTFGSVAGALVASFELIPLWALSSFRCGVSAPR